mgnify:CR=1 FL=1
MVHLRAGRAPRRQARLGHPPPLGHQQHRPAPHRAPAPHPRRPPRRAPRPAPPDLTIDAHAYPAPTPFGPDVVVEAHVRNWRDERVTLDGAAYAPGAPRQPGQIPRIEPGSDAVRRFVFAGAYTALKGEQIYIGFIDTDTEARLNASAIVP